jgi:hypothetical protein
MRESKKPMKPTRRDLLLVIGELQEIIGNIGSAYGNDRAADRAGPMQRLVAEGMRLCIAARSADPPLEGRWTGTPARRAPAAGMQQEQRDFIGTQLDEVLEEHEHAGDIAGATDTSASRWRGKMGDGRGW